MLVLFLLWGKIFGISYLTFLIISWSLGLLWVSLIKFLTQMKILEVIPPNRTKMNLFNDFLNKAGLIDLGYVGPKFTWINYRNLGSLIRTRVDRTHATFDWLQLFLETKILHLPHITLDHCPILLKTNILALNPLDLRYFGWPIPLSNL